MPTAPDSARTLSLSPSTSDCDAPAWVWIISMAWSKFIAIFTLSNPTAAVPIARPSSANLPAAAILVMAAWKPPISALASAMPAWNLFASAMISATTGGRYPIRAMVASRSLEDRLGPGGLEQVHDLVLQLFEGRPHVRARRQGPAAGNAAELLDAPVHRGGADLPLPHRRADRLGPGHGDRAAQVAGHQRRRLPRVGRGRGAGAVRLLAEFLLRAAFDQMQRFRGRVPRRHPHGRDLRVGGGQELLDAMQDDTHLAAAFAFSARTSSRTAAYAGSRSRYHSGFSSSVWRNVHPYRSAKNPYAAVASIRASSRLIGSRTP